MAHYQLHRLVIDNNILCVPMLLIKHLSAQYYIYNLKKQLVYNNNNKVRCLVPFSSAKDFC